MAYINVAEGVPGIRSLVLFRPETGKPLYELAQVLLRGPSSLGPAERELIAAYVSHRNECLFCRNSHAAAARCLFGEERSIVDATFFDPGRADLSPKMKALLHIAGQVQISGRDVTPADIAAARQQGADDTAIHDTVLIAATFSMFNRYVDGLASYTPPNLSDYEAMGQRLAEKGYVQPAPQK
jgi:uncharacterized peroxidase-related enzyme